MNSLGRETIDRIVELGAERKIQYAEKDGDPFIMVAGGTSAQSLAHLVPPKRIKNQVNLLEAGSFADYVNRFKTANTLIFANVTEDSVTFKALLDYHSPAPELKPAYCSHIAMFGALHTPDWKIWTAADRNHMSQVEFAEWLEDNQKLFVQPKGADLLELVRNLHGHCNARFTTALRLDNGAYSVSYDEDVVIKGSTTTKSDSIKLPPLIKAGVAVFLGAPAYEVNARLKSRVEDRKLTLYFETISMHAIVRESIMLLAKEIGEKTKIVPLLGTA